MKLRKTELKLTEEYLINSSLPSRQLEAIPNLHKL
jgi:hypothetical protein